MRASGPTAFLTLQVGAFGAAVAAGRPGWFLPFAVGSVALAGYRRAGPFGLGVGALGGALFLALAFPLALFVVRQDPALVAAKAADPAVRQALYLTVYAPLLAATVSVLGGLPLGYALWRGVPYQPAVESIVDLPLVVPHSVAGLVVLFGFGAGGAFPEVRLVNTLVGMVLALTFVSAPYAVNGAREALEAVDEEVLRAARVHGARPWAAFRRVALPQAARGVLTGGVLAWARAVSEFGAVAIVAYSASVFYPPAGESVRAQHGPVFIYNAYLAGDLAAASAVAVLLLALAASVFLAVRWLAYGRVGGWP
jgi:molybdate/tungstate transport system permease protein